MKPSLYATILACAALLAAAGPAQAQSPQEKSGALWSEMAVNELEALRGILADSHPGAFDPQNGTVRAWLAQGYEESLRRARDARDFNGMYFALRYFVDGFNDAHVTLTPALEIVRARYPGFIATQSAEGAFVVAESDVENILVGDVITACDGVTPNVLFERNVAPFFGVKGVAASDLAHAPYVFADIGNPQITLPVACEFRRAGQSIRVELAWRRTTVPALEARMAAATYGAPVEQSFEEWRDGSFWIGLPEFQFGNDADRTREQAMHALIASIKADASRVANAKVIVFDVRGNQGGSSQWGQLVLEAIWGEGFTQNMRRKQAIGSDWRPSPRNIVSMERTLNQFRGSFGPDAPRTREMDALVSKLREAARTGVALLPDYVSSKRQATLPALKKVKPKVILLTSGTCYSACLDFADSVLSIEGAEHWGADTQADSIYMENTSDALPSGLLRVSWPMKVYRGRFRGNNEAYAPKVRAAAPFRSTAQARAWVSDRLDGDAAARPARAAKFDAAYQAAHRGTLRIEVPEVYEIVNIAIALTPTAQRSDTLVYKDSEYYADVMRRFAPVQQHRFVAELDELLNATTLGYWDAKMNGLSFEYDARGRIVPSPVYLRTTFETRTTNSLAPLLEAMRDFAAKSHAREFYRAHRAFYQSQIDYQRDEMNIGRMISWLEKNYPRVRPYDAVRIVFSPLVARNQSVYAIEDNGFTELHPHVNFPYPRPIETGLSPAAVALLRGNILFTEINHGFNDPEADRYTQQIQAVLRDEAFWNTKLRTTYNTPQLVFNELMNWGLVCLYYVDVAPTAERAEMIARVERDIAERRGFAPFPAFSQFLVGLYSQRAPGRTLADLYPQIIEWLAAHERAR